MTRLIDADELKTKVLKEGTSYILTIIDNAETFSDRYDEGYAQGYVDGSTGADWKGEEE